MVKIQQNAKSSYKAQRCDNTFIFDVIQEIHHLYLSETMNFRLQLEKRSLNKILLRSTVRARIELF